MVFHVGIFHMLSYKLVKKVNKEPIPGSDVDTLPKKYTCFTFLR